jgi:hypothetical protein
LSRWSAAWPIMRSLKLAKRVGARPFPDIHSSGRACPPPGFARSPMPCCGLHADQHPLLRPLQPTNIPSSPLPAGARPVLAAVRPTNIPSYRLFGQHTSRLTPSPRPSTPRRRSATRRTPGSSALTATRTSRSSARSRSAAIVGHATDARRHKFAAITGLAIAQDTDGAIARGGRSTL